MPAETTVGLPPPSPGNWPTGFSATPELIVPLLTTTILLPAAAGMSNAEFSTMIPVPPALITLPTLWVTLMLPLLLKP